MTRDLSKRGAGLQASLLGPSRPGVPMPGKALAVPPLRAGTRASFPSPLPGSLPSSPIPHGQRKHFSALPVHKEPKGRSTDRQTGTETEGQWLRVKKLLKQQDGPLSSPSWRESPGQWKRSPLEGRSSGLREGGWLTLCLQCFSPKPDPVQWLL